MISSLLPEDTLRFFVFNILTYFSTMDLIKKGDNVGIFLRKIGVGLGWKGGNGVTGHPYDLDLQAFVLKQDGKFVVHPDDNAGEWNDKRRFFIYYNNLESPEGAVMHTGDVEGGEDEDEDDADDKETVNVDLDKLDSEATQIVFTATIEEADSRKQDFGQVKNSFIRVYNQENDEEICRYDLEDDFSVENAIEFGRLIRQGEAWEFEALGIGHGGGLLSLVNKFKVEEWG
jgi:tellurium resistance protein TerD